MNSKIKGFGAALVLSVLLVPTPSEAQGSRQGMEQNQAPTIDRILDRVFTDIERELIRDYYKDSRKDSLPPGLAKKDRLPPGLEKQLQKNGRLPPGLEKRALPHDLNRRLPARQDETIRRIIGNDIVLIDAANQIVLDIIEDIVR